MKKLTYFALVLILCFSACKKEEVLIEPDSVEPTPILYNVEASFLKYVNQFFEEGATRGRKLNKSNLAVIFEKISPNYCGLGTPNHLGTRRVTINESCWKSLDHTEKEYLIFHELGHAVLDRGHLNGPLPNGSDKSIMCSENCNGVWSKYTKYTIKTRDYYLDELFDEETPVPYWGQVKTKDTLLIQENFESQIFKWKSFVSNTNLKDNFSFEISAKDTDTTKLAKIVSNKVLNDNTFAGWRYEIYQPKLSEGGNLTLKAKITTKGLTGQGASIALRTESGQGSATEISAFSSTYGKVVILDDQELQEYSISIDYYPTEVKYIYIFLSISDKTKGEVQFDDIELIYSE